MLKLYNTLTKQLEEIPKKDHLNLYTCGPTVYNYAHIGNLRAFIMADLLYRALKTEGYNPKWVMNITDVDDKTIRDTIKKFGSQATVADLKTFTTFYFEEFKQDLKAVNVLLPEITFICVSDVMPQIQKFVIDLVKKGYGYVTDDGIYFSIEKYQKDFGDYGQLVGKKFLEGKKVGARVAVDEYEKENLSDFALWKNYQPQTDGKIFWPDQINDPTIKIANGRPGWHIECSVINRLGFNGEVTDIHTGGVDLIFPHHSNEIAQSQAAFGKNEFVKHWFHSEHLLVDGKKMAKSSGNFYTLKNLTEKGASGADFRYSMFGTTYKGQQNFTFESLVAAQKSRSKFTQENSNSNSLPDFQNSINEDLNIPKAIGEVLEKQSTLLPYNKILAIKSEIEQQILPNEVLELVNQRKIARENKNFILSDELRKQIEALGFELKDTSHGQEVKRKIVI